MTATVARRGSETYLPPDDGNELAQFQDFLTVHDQAGRAARPRYVLTGATPADQVEVPEEVFRVLRQVAEALSHGLAVTVAPQTTTLTTEQAA